MRSPVTSGRPALTTARAVGIISNMKARPLVDRRVILTPRVFAELVIWEVPAPLAGSSHRLKYRLALVADGSCVVRYDNEAGKGDHLHVGDAETLYQFKDVDGLIADFQAHVRRWLDEHGNS